MVPFVASFIFEVQDDTRVRSRYQLLKATVKRQERRPQMWHAEMSKNYVLSAGKVVWEWDFHKTIIILLKAS
jgi:hypothetical protein